MYTFQEVCVGDMFNTLTARWVKTSETEAICVMGALFPLGKVIPFCPDDEIVLLWSGNPAIPILPADNDRGVI